MSDARTAILDTIRHELARDPDLPASRLSESPDAAYARIPRGYQRIATLDHEAVLELFYDRLRDYDSELIFTDEAGIADAVLQAMREANESLLLVPTGVPEAWLPSGRIELRRDTDLALMPLEEPRTVLTSCTVCVAMSGTVMLEHGAQQGRRAATLLPDHHLCVIRKDQVFETVPQALEAVAPHMRAPITTVSGPSATSDIEMTRIRGVHGPRRLTAILI